MFDDHRLDDHRRGDRRPNPGGAHDRPRPVSRHSPQITRRAAARARAIVAARPRTELVDAAEFLQALLQPPSPRPDQAVARSADTGRGPV